MNALVTTAAIIALTHTALGVDHTLPFIALARARSWSLKKTIWVTLICGLGHVLSSVFLGFAGWWLATELHFLVAIEGFRGNLAGWLLLAFGIFYAVWGFVRRHEHNHDLSLKSSATFWTLFLIFAFGPCEPLIPLLLYPALNSDFQTALTVLVVFSSVTILTMLTLVSAAWMGLQSLHSHRLEHHAHTLAGLAIAASAAGILFLGL